MSRSLKVFSVSSTLTLALACSAGYQDDRGSKKSTVASEQNDPRPNSNSESAGEDTSTSTTSGGTKTFDGEKYFNENIEPTLVAMCESCHAPPRIQVANPGPRTIFSYSEMLKKLMAGPSATDNALIAKVTNRTSHSGGNQCGGGLSSSPCKEFIAWAEKETAARNPDVPSVEPGHIKDVTLLGVVSGWAHDPSDSSKKVGVRIYVGGPAATGTLVATVTADAAGYVQGNHAYSAILPPSAITNSESQVWTYAVHGDKLVELVGSPKKYFAYKSSAAGTDFYNANVAPQFQNQCTLCHGAPTLAGQFANLISPPKHLGGSKTNNKLVIKGSGGDGHPKGDVCGGANAGLCGQVQAWWDVEFGTN